MKKFEITVHDNNTTEISYKNLKKIVYKTYTENDNGAYEKFDTVYFQDGAVLGIVDYKFQKYGNTSPELIFSQIELKKPSPEAQTYIRKLQIISNLKKNPTHYNEYLQSFFHQKEEIKLSMVIKFFDLGVTEKELLG